MFVRFPSSTGMLPLNSFSRSRSVAKFVSSPISVGIVPVKLL